MAKFGKVAQVNELDEESLIGLKEGVEPTDREVPVSEKNPLGHVPHCQLPVSTKFPTGEGPCSDMEAAKKAADDEEADRLKPSAAQEASAATKELAAASEEEEKWGEMNKQIDQLQAQIMNQKTVNSMPNRRSLPQDLLIVPCPQASITT